MDCKVKVEPATGTGRKPRDRGGLIPKTTLRVGKAFRAIRSSSFVARIGGTGIVVAEAWGPRKVSVLWDVRRGRYDDFVRAPTREMFDRLTVGKLRVELDHWPSRAELAALGLQSLIKARKRCASRRLPDLGPLYW